MIWLENLETSQRDSTLFYSSRAVGFRFFGAATGEGGSALVEELVEGGDDAGRVLGTLLTTGWVYLLFFGGLPLLNGISYTKMLCEMPWTSTCSVRTAVHSRIGYS